MLSDRVSLSVVEHDEPGPWPRTTIGAGLEYLGMPAGYELTTLVHGILEAAAPRPRSATRRSSGWRRSTRTSRSRSTSPRPDRTARRPCCWRTSSRSPHHGSRRAGSRRRSSPSTPTATACCPCPRSSSTTARLGRRGARGRVRRARARRCRRLTVHTLNPVDAIDRANRMLERYAELARAELPAGARVFDAHTHLGDDIDGMVGDRDELLAIQRGFGIERSFTFCLDEPDRRPAFTAANDRTLAYAAAAPADRSRSSASTSTSGRSRRRPAASTAERAGSSCIPGHSGSSRTTRASSPSSRSRSSATSRS